MREKCPNTEFFSGPYFPVFSPNTGKYGPEKTLYSDTFTQWRYIEKAYNVANLPYPQYFWIQFRSVNVDDLNLSAIQSCQVNLFRSIKRKERLQKRSADVLKKRIRQEQTSREKAKKRMRKIRLKNASSFQVSDKISRKYDRVTVFKEFMKSRSCFICIICNKCLYRKSVVVFFENKHKELINKMFLFIPWHDNSFYICKTRAQELNKNQIPCQAVCIKLHIYDFPVKFRCIRRLERVLISRRLQFNRVNIMPTT